MRDSGEIHDPRVMRRLFVTPFMIAVVLAAGLSIVLPAAGIAKQRSCGFVSNPNGQGWEVNVSGVACRRARTVLINEDSSRCFSSTTGKPHRCTVDGFHCLSRFIPGPATFMHCSSGKRWIDATAGP